MNQYVLGRAAENDLFDIVTYTAEKWSVKQARLYAEKLERCMLALSQNEGAYKLLNEFTPPILVKHCEHHYIFGQQDDEHLLIIAILHERMDYITRLKDRLG